MTTSRCGGVHHCIVSGCAGAGAKGAGAVAVCRCCQDHVNNVAIEVSHVTWVNSSILDMPIDDDDIYPPR
jgi:hypothetical protein